MAAPNKPNNSNVTVDPAVRVAVKSTEKLATDNTGLIIDGSYGVPLIRTRVPSSNAAVVLTL